MRAIWSFWSAPFVGHHHQVWSSPRHHLFAWILSVETARQHCAPLALYTDDAGARLLVDDLGLAFDELHTSLNALSGCDPDWWALGKLHAYRAQEAPFVHLDNDVFLWKPLPERLRTAPLLAQNPEPFVVGESYYRPELFEAALATDAHGATWLPPEWRWYRASGLPQRAACCGLFGGTRTDFIRHYAARALHLIAHPPNASSLASLEDRIGHNILFEQYLLGACIDYHRARPDSAFADIGIEYLFETMDEAFDPEAAARVGYTHLIADAKKNPELAERLEARVKRDYPEHYARVLESCCVTPG